MPMFKFKPRTNQDVQRGNVVLVADTGDTPQMRVVRFTWKRGAQVAPFTGAINSRNRQRTLARQPGETPAPPEWGARWVSLADITHVAVR